MLIETEHISAQTYQELIDLVFAGASKSKVCNRLRISRPTHDDWLKNGIKSRQHVQRFSKYIEIQITDLRRRARVLDRWTTSGEVSNVRRITYSANVD